ncbi:MAG: Unknown protein [uncultured Sulfurovum sp.]|uniref:Membrane protein insertion efficiency factor YidD n=1 Tax=uncultured Sulfurovum sp. TaxID=269237 RepID=A0A6S6U280_9BACT|nr:MAG: Unknown protein [uncultured Sulfurovum sp.]
MLTLISVKLIEFYQKYISPYKGFCCAYRVYTGEVSCSQYSKIVIQENGTVRAFPLIRERFRACQSSAKKLEEERKKKDKQGFTDNCLTSCSCPTPSCSSGSGGLSCDACACDVGGCSL